MNNKKESTSLIGCCLPSLKEKQDLKTISFYRKRTEKFTTVCLKFDTKNIDEQNKFVIHKFYLNIHF